MSQDIQSTFSDHEKKIFQSTVGEIQVRADPLDVYIRVADYADSHQIAFWDELENAQIALPDEGDPCEGMLIQKKMKSLGEVIKATRFAFGLLNERNVTASDLYRLWLEFEEFCYELKKKSDL